MSRSLEYLPDSEDFERNPDRFVYYIPQANKKKPIPIIINNQKHTGPDSYFYFRVLQYTYFWKNHF